MPPTFPRDIFSVSSTTTGDSGLSPSSPTRPIYIVGFCLAGLVLLGLAIWLGRRRIKKRAAPPEYVQGSAYLSVRSMVREGEHERKEPPPVNFRATGSTASSPQQLKVTAGIVLPEKALVPPDSPDPTGNDIFGHHRQSGTFLRPFSFAINAASPPSPRSSLLNPISTISGSPGRSPSPTPPHRPSSGKSFSSKSNRFSVVSSCSSNSSVRSQGLPRKVRQLFTPVLPDELLLTRVGERLLVLQSFDDGWCVIGRENDAAKAASGPKSLFKSSSGKGADTDVEIGVVPAWCFAKPVKGLRAERPVRNSSLGLSVNMEAPSSRGDVISWSNF